MGVARSCVCWDGPQHEYAAVSQTLLPYLSVGQYACRLISQMGAAAARCVEGRGRASGYMDSLVVLPDLPLRPLLQTLVLLFSGPAHWKELAPACGGPTQSPINIDLRLVQRDYTLKPFIFQGYDSAPQDPWVLENDGHTELPSHPRGWAPVTRVPATAAALPLGQPRAPRLRAQPG